MHNSFHIRDLLRRMNADPMRLDRRNPHRAVAADPAATPCPGEFALAGSWSVAHAGQPGGVEAAADLADFLPRIGVRTGPGRTIRLLPANELPPRAFRIAAAPDEVRVEAPDTAGLWAGVACLEREMRVRRGPILREGTIVRTARWPVQISQGPWGGNYSVPDFSPEYLSDDAFRLYAHYGVTSQMIYGDLLCYVRSGIFPELDHPDADRHLAALADAARRAARYGVAFSYVVVGPKLRATHPVFAHHPNALGTGMRSFSGDAAIHCLCTSDEEVLAFYRETYDRLFRAIPELAGLILIIGGESYYHCRMWSHPVHECPRCYAREAEDVVAGFVGTTAEAVHRVKPGAFVNAWPYNIGGWDRPDGRELVRQLPEGVGFMSQFDRSHWYRKDGYEKNVWDYSVDYIGPADEFVARAAVARERGTPIFVRTETGIGLEVFQYPYVPAMQRLADKWQVVRDIAPAGVHQAWLFFGMFGSRAEELGLWAAYGDSTRDEFLREMARRDFGPDAAGDVLAAWAHVSEAVGHIPCVTLENYYVGPSFLGPCHPLVPETGATVPDAFHGVLFYLQEGEETFSHARNEIRSSLVMADLPESARSVGMRWDGPGDGWDIVLREYRAASARARRGWLALLRAAGATRTARDRENLREETLLAEAVWRTFESCANTVDFLLARRRLEKSGESIHREAMRRIARDEMENALAARHVYVEAPWLDLAERADGYFTPCVEMIDAKAEWIRRAVLT